jgi:hypothetical protein
VTPGVTLRHRQRSPVSTLVRSILIEDQRQSGIFAENQTQVDLDNSAPSGQQPDSISRSPTVTAAVPARPQTEPLPGTWA